MSDADRPVQHCPFCGELVGSFWGRSEAAGGTWCEACGTFFRVELLDEDGQPVPRTRGHGTPRSGEADDAAE